MTDKLENISDWRRNAVIYQVYPRSFADANNDGMGDIPGITAKIPHLAHLGIDAIWISPFYVSPQADAGYDVADYRHIDPMFGTLADFERLREVTREAGIKLIVDLVPNHTSDEHSWFKEALADRPGGAARERYIFREGAGRDSSEPPNDWHSVFGGVAWSRVTEPDGTPGQWYLHIFDKKQPDLNWRNSEVRAEFEAVLRFWLERGADGFRVDVAHGMIKAEGLPAWGKTLDGMATAGDDGLRPPMWDQDEIHEIYRSWRKVLDEYPGQKILVAEAWVPPQRLARYVRPDEMDQAFNFAYLDTPWDAVSLRETIIESMAAMASVGAPTTWVLSNHDVIRHATRFGYPPGSVLPKGISSRDEQPDELLGLRRAHAATALMLALPGSAYIYQGEELGLPEHTKLPDSSRQDPSWFRTADTLEPIRGRDGCRIPYPWQADRPNMGFNAGGVEPWLPQPESYRTIAADQQVGKGGSTFEFYRTALALRKEYRLGSGSIQWELSDIVPNGSDKSLVAFTNAGVAVVANTGESPVGTSLRGDLLLDSSGSEASQSVTGWEIPANATLWVRLTSADS